MVESVPIEFLYSWGSMRKCRGFSNYCNRHSETMMIYNTGSSLCFSCLEKFDDETKRRGVPVVNDAKYKCPEKNCDSILSFRGFLAGNCCVKSMNKSIQKNRLSEKHENHRTEFQDLKRMINFLEFSEKEENDARKLMTKNEKEYKLASTVYNEKQKAREKSRSNLTSSLTNAGLYIAEDKDKHEASKLRELKNLMEKHETTIKEEEVSKKKMDEDKKKLNEATAMYLKKKEKSEELRNVLSTTFIETAKDFFKTEERKENEFDKCNVCFEKYNKLDRHSCAPKCGHLTCQKCLNELPEKICPICREPFVEDNVIKVFLS